ncbi:MAG: nitroreductase family protein [Myxococcales bacterium]|nr:nitroreductase family protein [Myxococcales bacterium]
MKYDLAMVDDLLSTTRAVRKRLDLERPVEPEVVLECLRLSQQAPTGSNSQGWRWLVVSDAEKRRALAELYRKAGSEYLTASRTQADASNDSQLARVLDSALYLVEHLHRVPIHVIPCIRGKLPEGTPSAGYAGFFGSIFPSIWSFQLALRSRGLGSVLTTLHLAHAEEAAALLNIPNDVTQAALLPVAYTQGTEFRPAARRPINEIVYWDAWKETRE